MLIEKVECCPGCSGKDFRPYLETKDFTATNETFHVEQCAACGLLITNPRPTIKNLSRYYESPEYISHQKEARSLFDRIYLIIRHFTLNWKLRLIQNKCQSGNILDFGCGTGEFLNVCQKQGYTIAGVEPSNQARAIATEKLKHIYENLDQSSQNFDVITLWHVLEHIYPLSETIQLLKSRLKKDGIIFIAVPNWKSFDATYYKTFWAAYDVPRHVWHFSQQSIQTLLTNNGLKILEKIPMKLDAYYVSMLSEKYRNNRKLSLLSFIAAIIIGFRSNIKAKPDQQYSSLIYSVTHA